MYFRNIFLKLKFILIKITKNQYNYRIIYLLLHADDKLSISNVKNPSKHYFSLTKIILYFQFILTTTHNWYKISNKILQFINKLLEDTYRNNKIYSYQTISMFCFFLSNTLYFFILSSYKSNYIIFYILFFTSILQYLIN